MTQEEKGLLLKDLCARLPYKVIVKTIGENKTLGLWDIRDVDNLPLPYLRPMSSMTENEKNDLIKSMAKASAGGNFSYYITAKNERSEYYYGLRDVAKLDWLLAHHFDFRGLIPMGIAIESPEDMY